MRIAMLIVAIGVCACASANREAISLAPEMAHAALESTDATGLTVVEAVQYVEKGVHYTPECRDRKSSPNGYYCFDLKHTKRTPVIEMRLRNDSTVCYKEIRVSYELFGRDRNDPAVATARIRYVKPGVSTVHRAVWSYTSLPSVPLSAVRIINIKPGPHSCDGEAL